MPRTARPGPSLTAEDERNNRLFFRLLLAGNLYERQAQNALGYSGIQGALMGALSRRPDDGIPLSELVSYLSVSRQNLDGVLKRLEKMGYVRRSEDPSNRRIRVVRLTPEGLAAWRALLSDSLEFYRQATAGISARDKAAFADTLVRITRALRQVDMQAPRVTPTGSRA